METTLEEAGRMLKEGKVGVIPTDTIYGLVASAFDEKAVERLYALKGRDEDKPFIILMASAAVLERFGALANENVMDFLMEHWPAPLSVIVPVRGDRFAYLHRGKESLAFREPLDEKLQALLAISGPLAAPSANPQGESPASTIEEAKSYFGDAVDFYVDGGRLEGAPSTLVDARSGKVEVVRRGAYELPFD